MKKIYGNDYILSTLANMKQRNRTAHSVLFYGEKGTGKKLIAKFYTQLLMCENSTDGMPCGVCSACKSTESGINPDVVYVQSSGKLGGYRAETARDICSDVYIKPNNNSGKKVYIFKDCQKMSPVTQNILLKITEEPPDYAYFIFTSESKYDLLPTIISRCTCFGTGNCTENEAFMSLSENGYGKGDIQSAVSCFHGNIGMCEEYIENEDVRKQVYLTKSIADSIIRKDEYNLNAVLFSAGKERNEVRTVLSMLDRIIRDAVVLGENKSLNGIGCFREGAEKLSYLLTINQAIRLHKSVEKAWKAVECNVSIPLALTALSAEIIEII